MSFFQVIIPPLDEPFPYRVPRELEDQPHIGQRVLVPLRHESATGFLWEPVSKTDAEQKIKFIEQLHLVNKLLF